MKTSDFLKLLKKHPIFIENEVMINEAIKELEDLENRSCENCKFKYVVDSMCTECRCNESPIDYIDFDCFPFFSCREWKSKK